jgi:hypothetical protein
MRDAVRNFLKLLQEGKVWETEADAELGEKATSVGSTGKANSGPAGEAAGAEESGPAGKAAGADIEWHEEEINRLPDHTEYDYRIELVEGANPLFGPIYPLSENELQALREYLRKELPAGKIRRTHYICPETRRKHTALRGLSGSEEKMGITSSASPKGGEWKTAIRMRYGLLEHLGCHLLSEGIAMSPAKIQSIENWAELRSTENVLQFLGSAEKRRKRSAVLKLCEPLPRGCRYRFGQLRIGLSREASRTFSSSRAVRTSTARLPVQIRPIEDWAEPGSVENVQQFSSFANLYREVAGTVAVNQGLGCAGKRQEHSQFSGFANLFANLYRHFIEGFSKVARPLTALTAFNWAEAARSTLVTSKHLFTVAPILVHFHPERPTVIETDAAVLSQIQETKRLHPVAYHSRKFKPAEINYDVHDKEMLEIVTAFKEWEHMLKSVAGEITVYTDHKNLEYFATSKVLARRQARWSEHLAEFNFKGYLPTRREKHESRRLI